MPPERAIDIAQDRLSRLLEQYGHPSVDLRQALFVKEKDLGLNDSSYVVSRSKLFSAKDITIFEDLCAGGPSWIHFALILMERNLPLVAVAAGARISNPEPAINVAFEARNVVILDS